MNPNYGVMWRKTFFHTVFRKTFTSLFGILFCRRSQTNILIEKLVQSVFFQSLNVHFVVFLFWTMWLPLWKFLQKPNYKTASDLCKTSLCTWKNCFLKNQHTQHNYTSLVFHYKKERIIIILLCINSTIHAFN